MNKKGGRVTNRKHNIKACVLPSIHLPLTREASIVAAVYVRFWEGWCGRRDSTVCERLMSVQLYRYTHENINALSVRKAFSAVLVIYFTVWGLIIVFLTD